MIDYLYAGRHSNGDWSYFKVTGDNLQACIRNGTEEFWRRYGESPTGIRLQPAHVEETDKGEED